MWLSEWFNKTSMTSFRSFMLTLLFCGTVTTFTAVSSMMMLDQSSAQAVLSKDPAVSAAARTTETSHHTTGKNLADGILQVFVLALGIGAAAGYGDRTTSREHLAGKAAIEAEKTKGKIASANGTATKEHPALVAENIEGDVNIEQPKTKPRPLVETPAAPEPKWKDGREPDAGLL